MASNNRDGGNILDFLPIKKIEDGVVTYVTGKISKVMKVGCLNLAYLSVDDQRTKIRQCRTVTACYIIFHAIIQFCSNISKKSILE